MKRHNIVSDNRLRKIEDVVRNRQRDFVLVLEDIHDPHNAEAILRTADAFGVQKVYFIFENQEYYNPAKIGKSTSSSANKWLDFEIFRSTKDCMAKLQQEGYTVVATVLDQNAESLLEFETQDKKIALMLGNEHGGLSAEAIQLADRAIFISMRGMVQSLNVSVTAAICLWEMTRQRVVSKVDFSLDHKEQIKLVNSFRKK